MPPLPVFSCNNLEAFFLPEGVRAGGEASILLQEKRTEGEEKAEN